MFFRKHYKSLFILFIGISLLAAMLITTKHTPHNFIHEKEHEIARNKKGITNFIRSDEQVKIEPTKESFVIVINKNEKSYLSLNTIQNFYPLEALYDKIDHTYTLYFRDVEYTLTEDIPIIFKNGMADALNEPIINESELLLTLADWEKHFGIVTEMEEGKMVFKEERIRLAKKEITNEVEVIERLRELKAPIKDGKMTTFEGQLPGAPRTYRNGYHEGIDWYSGATGVEITMDTEVYPMLDGKIVRIDHDYVEMTFEERESLLGIAHNETRTPAYILDKLRGRQVWIQSENGVLIRYAHLSWVNPELSVGDQVTKFNVIARAGNSGTSNGALGTSLDIHPHTDILVYGKLFYEYFNSVDEANEELINILN